MKIKSIEYFKESRKIDLSTDEKKNLNFICVGAYSDLLFEQMRRNLYGELKSHMLSPKLDHKSKDNVTVEIIEENSHMGDLMFVDAAEFEHFYASDSAWKQKFDLLFSEIFEHVSQNEIADVSYDLSFQLEEFHSEFSFRIIDPSFARCLWPIPTDYVEREFAYELYVKGGKPLYPQNLTYEEKTWMFFAMLFFVRKLKHYDMPLIIDGKLFSHPDVDRLGLCEFISSNVSQALIFISEDVFFNTPKGLFGCRSYGVGYSSEVSEKFPEEAEKETEYDKEDGSSGYSLYLMLKAKEVLGSVMRLHPKDEDDE